MTAKSALAAALLDGHVLTVMNCFKLIGYTNIAREIPRMIEKPFDIEVSRNPKTANSRYGETVNYVEYRLNKSEHNLPGIEKMKAYIESQKDVKRLPCRPKKDNPEPVITNVQEKLF